MNAPVSKDMVYPKMVSQRKGSVCENCNACPTNLFYFQNLVLCQSRLQDLLTDPTWLSCASPRFRDPKLSTFLFFNKALKFGCCFGLYILATDHAEDSKAIS